MRTTARQLKAGGIFIAIGVGFLATSLSTLDTGSTLRMGPGFLPVTLSLLLVALGCAVIVDPTGDQDEETRPIPWRGLAFISLAPLLFAVTVKSLGLVPALLALIATTTLASRGMRLSQRLLVTAVLLALSVLLFGYGLKLPYPLFAASLPHAAAG